MSCLYILQINPLRVVSPANIISHSKGCFFHLVLPLISCAVLGKLFHLFCLCFLICKMGIIVFNGCCDEYLS